MCSEKQLKKVVRKKKKKVEGKDSQQRYSSDCHMCYGRQSHNIPCVRMYRHTKGVAHMYWS